MLPFALGAAVFAGVSLDNTIALIRSRSDVWSSLSVSSLVLFGLLLTIAFANNVNNARLQIAVDEANSEMLALLADQVPTQGLVIVNIQDPNEYFDEIRTHLSALYGRPDIVVEYFRYQAELQDEELAYVVIMPEIMNQMPLSVRLGVTGPTQAEWNTALDGFLGGRPRSVQTIKRRFQLFNFELPRLACPLVPTRTYCREGNTILDRRDFSYGWNILTLSDEGPSD